jgi:hypothetical protein
VDAESGSGMCDNDIDVGWSFGDVANGVLFDGTMLMLSEFTAVRLDFLANTVEVFA